MDVGPDERCMRYVSIQYDNEDDHNDEFSWRGIVADATDDEAIDAARRARDIRSEKAKQTDGTAYTRYFTYDRLDGSTIPVDEPVDESDDNITRVTLVNYYSFSEPLVEWLARRLIDRSGSAVNSPEVLADVLKAIGASASLNTFRAVMAGESE